MGSLRPRVRYWSACTALAIACCAGPALAQFELPGASPSDLAPPTANGNQLSAQQVKGQVVQDVVIEGNHSVDRTKVLHQLKTRPGLPLDPEVLSEDVRRLVANLKFIDVRVLFQQSPQGLVVTFKVVERPTLHHVTYIGNKKFKADKLSKETGLKEGQALDLAQIAEGRRKIEEMYHKKGYNEVQVTIAKGTSTDDREAVYVIDEGPAQKVAWVNFVGNEIASAARLRTQLTTKRPKAFFFGGYYKPEDLDADIDKLVAYYHALGYWDVRVGREVSFNTARTQATVTFVIDEGPRFEIRNVSFIGNKKFDENKFRELITLKENQFFDQGALQKDVQVLKDLYGSQGHVFCDVRADARYLEEPGRLDLVYQIDEGARYRVGRINVKIMGPNPHTKITTVLNRLSLRPGDIVDIRELRDSERRLKASGLFKVDPSHNIVPKIVFTPPELEKHSRTASRAQNYRGQSPDNFQISPQAVRAGEQVIDLVLEGELTSPHQPPPPAPRPVPRPSHYRLPPELWRPSRWPGDDQDEIRFPITQNWDRE